MPKNDVNLTRWSKLAEANSVFAPELIYRGIEINEIVEGFTSAGRRGYEETAYLLLFGELPNADELAEFEDALASYRKLPRQFVHHGILDMPSRDIMNALARTVLSLYTLDDRADDTSIANVLRQSLHLIAKLPMLSVYAYQAYLDNSLGKSLVIHRPVRELSTAENFLHMLRSDSKYTELEATLLDLSLVVHAEHGGGNNSTFTTRVVTSSMTDTYSVIAAALGALKGPRHGGANIKALEMLADAEERVRDWEDEHEIAAYLGRILDKQEFDRSGLIYGMGHPVYSVSDPRALILKRYAEMLAVEKGVSANVDFYSGFVCEMLRIPKELFTPLFAISRVAGWCAHRIEEIATGGKIIRPAYKAVGARREYTPLEQR